MIWAQQPAPVGQADPVTSKVTMWWSATSRSTRQSASWWAPTAAASCGIGSGPAASRSGTSSRVIAHRQCHTLNRNLDVIQVPQRSITLESSCCPEVSIGLPDCQLAIQVVPTTSQQRVSAPAITLDREPFALRSTRNHPRRAVRQGAAWAGGATERALVVP
jgi:hypothetical protein